MRCDEIQGLLPAHADREIGLPEAVEIDKHLRHCTGCQARYAQLQALRAAVKDQATYFESPKGLSERIMSALPRASTAPLVAKLPGYLSDYLWSKRWNIGAAFASVAAIVWSVGLYLSLPSSDSQLAEEIVSSHVRSLLSARPADVLSSDRHSVKPWFSGKLDYSLPVFDLATNGFPLVGGRLDYLHDRTVAALVYRHREHTVSLYVVPVAEDGRYFAAESLSKHGYNIVGWTKAEMNFWAISDVDLNLLRQFRDAFVSAQPDT